MLRFLILGLLSVAPRHGYELKQAIEDHFGGTWPINPGQIYTTLDRLERDGFVERTVVTQDVAPDRHVCSVTEAGRAELKVWLGEPVEPVVRVKDELFAKAVVARIADNGAATDLIWRQRDLALRAMGAITRARDDADPTSRLLLDGALLRLEADLAWLDRWEEEAGPARPRGGSS
jgi:DNA-binding PadR family transcriptional regulator